MIKAENTEAEGFLRKTNKVMKNKTPKQFKIWIFFEMDDSDRTSTIRGIAMDKDAKERFEISLTNEMRIRNEGKKNKIWWTVEENLINHLFASEMYEASRVALRNYKKYRVGNREIDGD